MSTYRCAIDGLMPSAVCEYYRVDSRTCGAPDPDHCPDSLHDEDWRQRDGAAASPEATMTDLQRLHDWHQETADTMDGTDYADIAAETARILALLLRVRKTCRVSTTNNGFLRAHVDANDEHADTLRDLAELLGGGT